MTTVLYLQISPANFCTQLKYSGAARHFAARGVNLRRIVTEKPSGKDLGELISFWEADGVILDCGGRKPPEIDFDSLGIPAVYLDIARGSEAPGRASVSYDIRATCHLAARELLQFECAAYGYAGYGATAPWSEERGRVFAKAMELNGYSTEVFALNPKNVSPSVLYRRLSTWLKALPRPMGIFAADDTYAVYVHDAAEYLKLRIPGDIAILGVDGEEVRTSRPGISSISLDFAAAGRSAAELMEIRLGAPGEIPPNRYFGPVQLLRRGSTRRLRKQAGSIEGILVRIREHATEGISAAEVAGWIPGSRRTAEIRFREVTGRSILEEITAVRIDRAKALLSGTDLRIGEVAFACGYRTFNAFRDAFKTVTGRTPRDYRGLERPLSR